MSTKILIVDDEPLLKSLILQKFKSQINNKDMEFLFANNGIEALQTFHGDEDVGIIFTDLNMPEMDGLTLLSHLLKQERFYRAVVISAYGDMSNIRAAMNQGATDFITKPIDLSDLETTINRTIKQYNYIQQGIVAQHQMIEINNELKIAHYIQQSFIPHDFTPLPNNINFTLLGEMIPAAEVGGDFFDFFPISQDKLGLVIADVSGHGIPSALFMAMSEILIYANAHSSKSPSECLRKVNHILSLRNTSSMFVTVFYGIFDVTTGELQYCGGGHNPPYIITNEGNLIQIARAEGIALGVLDDITQENSYFVDKTVKLKKNDCLFMYTDGVTEVMNRQGELFSEANLENYLKTCSNKPIPLILKDLKEELTTFAAGSKINDDITVLCLRYTP